jgi:hypothetical protein
MESFNNEHLALLTRVRATLKQLAECYMTAPMTHKSANNLNSLEAWASVHFCPKSAKPENMESERSKLEMFVWAIEATRIRYYFHVIDIHAFIKSLRLFKGMPNATKAAATQLMKELAETWASVRQAIPYSPLFAGFHDLQLSNSSTILQDSRSHIPNFLPLRF